MWLEPVNVLEALFAFTAAFAAVLIWPQPRFRGLCVFLLLESALMLFNFLEETGITHQHYLITPAFALANGPALYLLVRYLVYRDQAFSPRQLCHLLPMLAVLPLTGWPQLVLALGTLSQVIYVGYAIALVRRYHQASLATRADAESLTLRWVVRILACYVVIGGVDLVRLNLQPYLPLVVLEHWYFANQTLFFLLTCSLIYQAIRQPQLFDGLARFEQLQSTATVSDLAATDPAAEHATAHAVFAQLDQLLRQQAVYRQTRLSLTDVAAVTGMSEKDISWAINQGGGRNFCEYINALRIDAVRAHLQAATDDGRSILDIALQAGFNSKSTFNAVFKRETGMTPSDYLRQQRAALTVGH